MRASTGAQRLKESNLMSGGACLWNWAPSENQTVTYTTLQIDNKVKANILGK